MTPNYISCHTHGGMHCSILNREASCDRLQLTQKPTTGQCAENKRLECSVLNGMSMSHAFPQGARIYAEEGNMDYVRIRDGR